MTDQTYTMHIETNAGITQHGYHLGTDLKVAEQFALEALNRAGVLSVALRVGPKAKLVRIFDWRDMDHELKAAAKGDLTQAVIDAIDAHVSPTT